MARSRSFTGANENAHNVVCHMMQTEKPIHRMVFLENTVAVLEVREGLEGIMKKSTMFLASKVVCATSPMLRRSSHVLPLQSTSHPRKVTSRSTVRSGRNRRN